MMTKIYELRYDNSDKHGAYLCHFGTGLKLTDYLDIAIGRLERAKAWCQADYDKYYEEMSDDK